MRYNILRIALGAYLAVSIIAIIKEPETISRSEWVAIGLGVIAVIANYWPEPKGTKPEDRA